jgi:hypothetical protein
VNTLDVTRTGCSFQRPRQTPRRLAIVLLRGEPIHQMALLTAPGGDGVRRRITRVGRQLLGIGALVLVGVAATTENQRARASSVIKSSDAVENNSALLPPPRFWKGSIVRLVLD